MFICVQFVVTATTMVAFAAGSVPVRLDAQGLQRAGLTQYWEANLPLADGDAVRSGHLVDEALYIATELGTLFSVTADVGLIRWGVKLSEWKDPLLKPTHVATVDATGPVVVARKAAIQFIDRFTGDVVRRITPPFAVGGGVIAIGANLFAGGLDGMFYSFDWWHATGERPIKLWELRTGGPVFAAPSIYDGDRLVFASRSGGVYSCKALDKTYLWSFRTGGSVVADPVVVDDAVYVASTDRSVYKLHAGTGELQWRLRLDRPLRTAPIVAADTVFQPCEGRGLVAAESATGREKWRCTGGTTLAAHLPRRDLVFTQGKFLKVVEHESGEVLLSIYTSPTSRVVPNARNDAVYLVEDNGHVTCLRSADVPYLHPRKVSAATAVLTLPPARQEEALRPNDNTPVPEGALSTDDPFRSRRDLGR